MSTNREKQKQEAIKRMKSLALFEPCISAFKKRDEVQFSESTGGLYEFHKDEWLNNIVKSFEEEHNALVYNVIHTFTNFGELYNLLYVSNYEEEWEMDNEDIKDNYVFAYVANKTYPDFSEFGTIVVENRFGGLIRVG